MKSLRVLFGTGPLGSSTAGALLAKTLEHYRLAQTCAQTD
jgi:hypothetical protein